MSLYDYKKSQEIDSKDYGFYALIMAAMREADSVNLCKLKYEWPDIYTELQARYNSPGGKLENEQ